MCKLCGNYNFGSIGWSGTEEGTIQFYGGIFRTKFDGELSFKFCPVCGKKLTEENFKNKY